MRRHHPKYNLFTFLFRYSRIFLRRAIMMTCHLTYTGERLVHARIERWVNTSASESTNLLSYIVISIIYYILLVSTFSPQARSDMYYAIPSVPRTAPLSKYNRTFSTCRRCTLYYIKTMSWTTCHMI